MHLSCFAVCSSIHEPGSSGGRNPPFPMWLAQNAAHQSAEPLSSYWLSQWLPVPVKLGQQNLWLLLQALQAKLFALVRCSDGLEKKKKKKKKDSICFIRRCFLYAMRTEPSRVIIIIYFNCRVTYYWMSFYSACSLNTDYANNLSK